MIFSISFIVKLSESKPNEVEFDNDVYKILQEIELPQAAATALNDIFAREEVDNNAFVNLSDSGLKELGINNWGQRRRILAAATEHKEKQWAKEEEEKERSK